ncbi:MAG: hypothetical protein ACR2QW_10555 [bacterium]
MDNLKDFIDLGRYPIHRLDSADGRALLDQCHAMMESESMCALPGFLLPEATSNIAKEINKLESVTRKVDFLATPYGWMDNTGFPKNHPRSQLMRRRCGILTTEQIDPEGPSCELFNFDLLTEFVQRLLKYDALYRSTCPTISVRANTMGFGEEFGWHYDTNDGVVSFITQNPEAGGGFEYAPLIRSEEDENYTAVERFLDGTDTPRQPNLPAGTFTLFLGRRSLHRVAKVLSHGKTRQSLLFSYDRKPNMVFPEKIRKRLTEPSNAPFYGLVTPNGVMS